MLKLLIILPLFLSLLCCTAGSGAEPAGLPDKLPEEYMSVVPDGGTVVRIEYPSRDYASGQAEITKPALVYLPAGYSEEKQYDLLVLCHGIGGTENEWGFMNNPSIGKNLVDHLIANGEIKPLIIVMPNGRSTADCGNTDWSNMNAFYSFGQEIRNDLLPWMDTHYATYSSLTPDDPAAAREHRYMAGLSMGGMQTINIGMCECLDLFSSFGAFSAAPTSYPASQVAAELRKFDSCPIRIFYNVCGTEDGIAYASASAAAKNLPDCTDLLTADNWIWQECPGDHNFDIWYLGLFNFLRILGN